MTSKQRAALRAQANALTPILFVGKGGRNPQLDKQADEALEARELIKGRVLETAPLTAAAAAAELAQVVGAEVVQVIGRNFVLYRKKKENA